MIREASANLRDVIEDVRELYRQSPLVRSTVQGIAFLIALLVMDVVCHYPSGLRIAYVFPLWFATKNGGKRAGWIMVGCTTFVLAVIDANHNPASIGMYINLVIQTLVLTGLMRGFYSFETRLRDATQRATKDPLTGLYNRFALEMRAKKTIDRALLLDRPLVMAMIDCDRFKELNDTFGHPYGDIVLKHLARTLRRALPNDAVVGRTGGDEFMVIVPDRSDDEAAEMMDHALERFMSLTDIVGRCSGFSYGLAMLREDGIDYDRLHDAADQDMYRRKSVRSTSVA